MRLSFLLLCFSLFFVTFPGLCQTFVGTAVNKNEQKAKQLAFTDLQQNMYVTVESQSQAALASDRPNYYRLTSKLSSSLPILGASPDCVELLSEFQCQVSLKKESASLYRATIAQKQSDIEQDWLGLKNASADKKFVGLKSIYHSFEQLKPLLLVYRLLDPSSPLPQGSLNLSPSKVQSELHRLQRQPDSIEMLALSIAQQYKDKERIFVKPLTVEQSLEITPFAKALHSQLLKHLDAINDKDYAFYLLTGTYGEQGEFLQVQTTLTSLTRENQGMIAGATSNMLGVKFIGSVDYQPKQLNFDLLLQRGQILSNSLTAKLQTNHGSRDLLFTRAQSVKLLVKVNRPAYYYLLGHSDYQQKKHSYLLDLTDAQGPERFVHFLGHDQVNRWVTIGEFEVQPPFGIETLQLFASEREPTATLPATQFDGTYYKINGSKAQVVEKTRGLVRKRRTEINNKAQTAEALLRFTTSDGKQD